MFFEVRVVDDFKEGKKKEEQGKKGRRKEGTKERRKWNVEKREDGKKVNMLTCVPYR